MLPPKLPKRPKRESRWRSQAHLSFVRSHQCSMPGCADMPIEAAHVRNGSGAGLGQKPCDYFAVSLCARHHQQQHSMGEDTFWKLYQTASGQGVERLIEAFCQGSPKRSEIARAKAGPTDGP
jgi:hypothetical protein